MPSTELQAWLTDTVRAGMLRKGWTQAETAAVVHCTEKHLSAILTGRAAGSIALWDTLLQALDLAEQVLR
jgi:plasmid maintenance system antidote protein VapI